VWDVLGWLFAVDRALNSMNISHVIINMRLDRFYYYEVGVSDKNEFARPYYSSEDLERKGVLLELLLWGLAREPGPVRRQCRLGYYQLLDVMYPGHTPEKRRGGSCCCGAWLSAVGCHVAFWELLLCPVKMVLRQKMVLMLQQSFCQTVFKNPANASLLTALYIQRS